MTCYECHDLLSFSQLLGHRNGEMAKWYQSVSIIFPTFCGVVMPTTGGLGQGTGPTGLRDFKGRYLRNSVGDSIGYGYPVI